MEAKKFLWKPEIGEKGFTANKFIIKQKDILSSLSSD